MNKYEGKTLDEAIECACKDKNVVKEDLTYYVVEEKAGGLFGIGAKTIIEAYAMEDISKFITSYMNTYFENIHIEADVFVKIENECFMVDVDAKNNAVLIGRVGKTLQAINTVVKAAASAEFRRHINVLIDINGYKKERYEKLKSMVSNIAKTVAKTKVPAKLGMMTNDERKVIHQYLSTFPHVKTESEGEGMDRRLKIIYSEKQ